MGIISQLITGGQDDTIVFRQHGDMSARQPGRLKAAVRDLRTASRMVNCGSFETQIDTALHCTAQCDANHTHISSQYKYRKTEWMHECMKWNEMKWMKWLKWNESMKWMKWLKWNEMNEIKWNRIERKWNDMKWNEMKWNEMNEMK